MLPIKLDVISNDNLSATTGCCGNTLLLKNTKQNSSNKTVSEILLQDQEGNTMTFEEYFINHPSVVVFYYTRCENLNRCSLTIQNLGRLQKLMHEKGLSGKVKTASISYDSEFDIPARIKKYGIHRKMCFNSFNKAFRVVDQDETNDLLNYFNSSENFSGGQIDEDELELYVLNNKGEIHASYVRSQWKPSEIIERLQTYLSEQEENSSWHFSVRKLTISAFNTLVPILIAFFPKCPLCWAGYLSLFGVASISSIPYAPWLLPFLCIFLGINLWFLWKRSSRTNRWLSFYLAFIGAVMLILFGPLLKLEPLSMIGMILLICGSLLNSLPKASGNWSNIFSRS